MPNPAAGPDLSARYDNGKLQVWLALLRTARGVETDLRVRCRQQLHTTLPRFDVMAALYRSTDGLGMSALTSQLLIANGNATSIVERLAADGLVERTTPTDDRRAVVVRLTTKGRTVFADMATAHDRWIDEILAPLAEQDVRAILSLLTKVHAPMTSS